MACAIVGAILLSTAITFIICKAIIVLRTRFQLELHCDRVQFVGWLPTAFGAVVYLAAYIHLISYEIAFVLLVATFSSMKHYFSAYVVNKQERKKDIPTGVETACNYLRDEIRNQIYLKSLIIARMKEENLECTDDILMKMLKIDANVSAILEDSMNLAKWHSGEFLENFVPFPILSLFNRIASYATAQGLVVGALPPVLSTLYVLADEHLLNKAVQNLISNACKYGQGRPASVAMAFEKTDDKEGVIVVTVVDKGCGMTPDQLQKSTEPFANIRTTAIAKDGTGLSLPLTKAIIELGHKGSLLLASDGVDMCVTATIRLPDSGD